MQYRRNQKKLWHGLVLFDSYISNGGGGRLIKGRPTARAGHGPARPTAGPEARAGPCNFKGPAGPMRKGRPVYFFGLLNLGMHAIDLSKVSK